MKAQTNLPPPPAIDLTPIPDQWIQSQTFVSAVWVPMLQNVGGGVGAFVLVLTVLWQIAGLDFTPAVRVAGIIAGLVFGISLVIRMFRDEVRFVLSVWAEHRNTVEKERLELEIKRLADEITRIKSEAIPATRYETQADAERLLFAYFRQGQKIGRREVMERGQLNRPRWERATALMRKAQVIDGRDNMRAPTYAAAWASIVRYTAESTSWTRTADEDWTKT